MSRALYVLYGVKYIDLVSLVPHKTENLIRLAIPFVHPTFSVLWGGFSYPMCSSMHTAKTIASGDHADGRAQGILGQYI